MFAERLFRIPGYQRGFDWGIKQIKEFGNDLQQLEGNKNHYVGVFTVERVPKKYLTNRRFWVKEFAFYPLPNSSV